MMRISITALAFTILISIPVTGQQKLIDSRDKNEYKIVNINGAIWMSENLRYKGLPGTSFFDNDENNSTSYGALYDWKTAVNACPVGWHLPSGEEFRKLMDHYGFDNTWVKGSNEAFHIQLGGHQDYQGVFFEQGESAYYWTSVEYDETNAEYFSYIIIDNKRIIDISRKEDIEDIHGSEKVNKYSVRCVQN
ncbi:MAG TPA: FISUMP domain-containing protein [Bacteroidales bacterium]|nr:FISUMP domain-containing protein [Bacteroidales bacterium]